VGLKKLRAIWNKTRDSLWFLPAVITVAGAALAVLMVGLDQRGVVPEATAAIWLRTGSSDGARGVLSAIAAGLITVTGVVFSVTIVALQLASTQYTPRVLRNFTADRASQVVLGVFIGTFTYSLLVLRVVRGEEPTGIEDGEYFLPHLAIVVAVVLALVSIGFLIFFVNHLARSIQASVLIARVTKDTLRTMERLLPARFGEEADDDVAAATPAAQGSIVTARDSGYVQGIDHDSVSKILDDGGITVRLERRVGEFVLPGATLATVWPAVAQHADDDPVVQHVRNAYVMGAERTPYMDLEHGVIELADIAVKALSPGINDPTTAVLCVDRLSELLLAFARRDSPGRVRRHDGGGGTLILPRAEFERLTDLALDQVRHFGVGDPRFAISLLDRLAELGKVLPRQHRQAVARHAAATLRDARRQIDDDADLNRVERAARRALQALEVGPPHSSDAGDPYHVEGSTTSSDRP
jgi:uncharacterized membrane protein